VISAALSCTTIAEDDAALVAPIALQVQAAHTVGQRPIRPTPNSDIFLSKSKEKKGAENSDIWWPEPCQVATEYRRS
jgi:hypothetical protein